MLVLSSLKDPRCLELLQQGKVGLIATDTVYGLCALASDKSAAVKMYGLKPRGPKPGTLIAANIQQLADLGINQADLQTAMRWWPGPVSIVLPAPNKLGYLHLGLDSLAVRIPADKDVSQFLEHSGALITSSANPPGQPPAVNLEQAIAYFGEGVDFYVDGGDRSNRPSSTVARLNGSELELLRKGAFRI